MGRKTSWKLTRYPKIALPCIGLLMDRIEEPCILIDLTQDSVVQVNGELLRITGFSNNEICFAQPSGLIHNYHEINIIQNEFQVQLIRKNKDNLHITAKVIPLDNESKWLLIELLQSGPEPETKLKTLTKLINAISNEKDQSNDEFINRISKTLHERIAPHQIVVYQKKLGTNIYSLISGIDSNLFFPKTYESDDLGNLKYPITWFPGNRVMNGFQRLARINNLSYLTICPIRSKDELNNLLIVFSNSFDDSPYEQDVWLSICNMIGNIQSLLEIEQKLINEKNIFEKQNILLYTICNNIPVGVLHIRDNQIIYSNDSANNLLGYSKWEIKKIKPNELFTDNEYLLEITSTSEEVKEFSQIRLNRRDGVEFSSIVHFIPIINSNNLETVNEKIMILTDISELETLKLEKIQLNQQAMVGMMMAYFAHDVRNIVNSIQLAVSTMELKVRSENNVLSTIEGISEDCDRITLLMESILSYSRSIESLMKPVDIVTFLQRVIDKAQSKLLKFKIRTVFQVQSEIPQIIGDLRSLEQVFSNLINNAKDAMAEKGGTLAVDIDCIEKSSAKHVIIKIADTGPGIPDDFLKRLFEPYRTTREGGTGLGLVISKQIVNAHKGEIKVDSFSGGTTFTISIPAIPLEK